MLSPRTKPWCGKSRSRFLSSPPTALLCDLRQETRQVPLGSQKDPAQKLGKCREGLYNMGPMCVKGCESINHCTSAQ